jgi:MFS family permease
MSTSQSAPILSPLMRWFMFALVLANIAGQMSPMLLPIYLTELGASISQVGLVFTLTSVVILVLQVMGGWISDNIGRLRAIAIGSLGGILGFVALLLAPTWQWMLVALAIYQIPFSLVGPSAPAFIAENSTEENRGRVYGLTGTIYQITGVVGPAMGGLLAGMWGFKRMLLVAAAFYTIAAGLRIWMATTTRSSEQRQATPLSLASFKSSITLVFGTLVAGGVITWILVTDGIGDIAFRMSHELQPLYLQRIAGLSIQQIGLLGSIFAVATMFTPMLSGKLSDQYGERLPILSGFLLTFGGYLIFLRAGTFALFAGAWIIFGASAGLLEPAYQSLISKVVPANRLGMFSGLFWSSLGVLSLPAPWLGAQLWDRIDPRAPFVITAIASLLMLPPVWLKFKAPQKAPEALAGATHRRSNRR